AFTAASTFLARCPSMKGPFFTERGTGSNPHRLSSEAAAAAGSLLPAPTDDHLVRQLVGPGLVTFGRLAPRADRVAAAGGTPFAAPRASAWPRPCPASAGCAPRDRRPRSLRGTPRECGAIRRNAASGWHRRLRAPRSALQHRQTSPAARPSRVSFPRSARWYRREYSSTAARCPP